MAGVSEQDQCIPIANLIRIMRKILPPHVKISNEAKETIQECVSEYIGFITAEANERRQCEQRKTVTADDVVWAMGKLGLDDYYPPMSFFLARYRESEGEAASVRRASASAASASASACALGMGMGMGMHPHPLPVLPHPPPHPHQPQPYTHNHRFGMFDFDPTLGFDIASASASGPGTAAPGFNIASFDPYGNKRDYL